MSTEWRDDALEEQRGTSANTWAGNLRFCKVYRPVFVEVENLLKILQSSKLFGRISSDLSDAGYAVAGANLNAAEYGFPHWRPRAYLGCAPAEICLPDFQARYVAACGVMRVDKPFPVHRFLLDADSPLLESRLGEFGLLRGRQAREKWKADHWEERCHEGVELGDDDGVDTVLAMDMVNHFTLQEKDICLHR